MKRTRLTLALGALLMASIGLGSGEPKLGTFKVDVVSLISQGKEVEGATQFAAERYGYRYLFSSKANLEAFKSSPAKFEVQLGGACGKMAELSGRGNPQRYWVYQGKLYIFASDSCRTGFQSNPAGHIEKDEPKVVVTELEARRGRDLLNRAAKWSGLDKLPLTGSVAYLQDSELKQGETLYKVKGTTRISGNGDFYDITTYNGAGYANQIQKGRATEIDSKGVASEHVPTWKRALERQRARQLAYLLWNRNSKNLTVKLDGVADGIASVAVNLDGATSTLWIEEKSGKVLSQTVKGRSQQGIIGDVQMDFVTYVTANGVTLPVAWIATYNGQDSVLHERRPMRLEVKK